MLAYLAPAGAQEGSGTQPDVFRGSTSSLVASVSLDRPGLLPVEEVFAFKALEGQSSYESSNQAARASILFPGNGILLGPGLACGTFGAGAPPEFAPLIDACLAFKYPLTVFADSLNPDASSEGAMQLGAPSDPLSAKAARAVAHAALDSATTEAVLTNLRVVGFPGLPSEPPVPLPGQPRLDSSLLTIDAASSVTEQRIDPAGTLIAVSQATLDGVRLIAGLIEIDSIVSLSKVTDDGHGAKTHEASLQLGGVTVAGRPAQITDKGLVLDEPSGSLGPLEQQAGELAKQLLDQLGVRITTLEITQGVDDDGIVRAQSDGVLIEVPTDVTGLPVVPGPTGDLDPNGTYTGTIQLGATGATGIALQVDIPPFVPAISPAGGGAFDAPGTGAANVPGLPGADQAAVEAPAIGAGSPQQQITSFFEELYADRIRLVYLAFTLTALGLCLAPKLSLPARLPGVSS